MVRVLKIREVGDPILATKCKEIDINNINKEILDQIEDLKETLEFGKGIGIAASQVGINKRIIVVRIKKENITYCDTDDIPTTVMINPTWKKISDETEIEFEGCMSVPVIRGKVERYKDIELTYYTEKGEKVVKEVNGLFSRVIQHECDHLDGILYIEKVEKPNGFATLDMINKYKLRDL